MERKDKKKILVVDDHEDNIELLRARLEARGYEVFGASDGQAALDQVDKVCPDLILLDVMMPKMDGMEVVRRLKANDKLPFIPVIMQTALDSTENKVEGLDAGADDYITKPINFAELEARVNSLLRIKALQADLAAREKELSELNDRLRQISLTDGLTQVENRRSLEERLMRTDRELVAFGAAIEHVRRLREAFEVDRIHWSVLRRRVGSVERVEGRRPRRLLEGSSRSGDSPPSSTAPR